MDELDPKTTWVPTYSPPSPQAAEGPIIMYEEITPFIPSTIGALIVATTTDDKPDTNPVEMIPSGQSETNKFFFFL